MAPRVERRSYEEWKAVFNRELGVVVVDDEGQRRTVREGVAGHGLTRREAEIYYLRNSFVRRRARPVRES